MSQSKFNVKVNKDAELAIAEERSFWVLGHVLPMVRRRTLGDPLADKNLGVLAADLKGDPVPCVFIISAFDDRFNDEASSSYESLTASGVDCERYDSLDKLLEDWRVD